MVTFSDLPTEILQIIVDLCPRESIEGLGKCCTTLQALCQRPLEEHMSGMKRRFQHLHLTPGLSEREEEMEAPLRFLETISANPTESIYNQSLTLTESSGFYDPRGGYVRCDRHDCDQDIATPNNPAHD